jgi:hypothetical protein
MDKKNPVSNDIISINQFKELARVDDMNCVSVYVPTKRAGSDRELGKSSTMLKNAIREGIERLTDTSNMNQNDAENYLGPVSELVDDSDLWRNQSDCLALFLNNEGLQVYPLPIDAEYGFYLADHFYLLPMFELFNDSGRFYILSLSQQKVQFFECTEYSIREILIDDLAPGSIEESAGYDFQDRSLQFRTGQGGEAGVLYHGQGSGKDDTEAEVLKFFKEIDDGIVPLINGDNSPLILACDDQHLPVYRKVSNYSGLFSKNISGNHDATGPLLLHELGWSLVSDYFRKDRNAAIERFRDYSGTSKAATEIEDIIPAAFDGRIKDLFIDITHDSYGIYDHVNRNVIYDQSNDRGTISLFNLAAIQSWMRNGRVFISNQDTMPVKGTGINALMRY